MTLAFLEKKIAAGQDGRSRYVAVRSWKFVTEFEQSVSLDAPDALLPSKRYLLDSAMPDTPIEISTVIPVYRSAKTLDELYTRLSTVLDTLTDSWEALLVNDGSPDESWEKLIELSRNDKRVVSINLMRNLGQHNAVMCGLSYSRGNYVITLDDDLQHPPEEIPKLLEEMYRGTADVVVGTYGPKRHNFFRNLGTLLTKQLNFYTLGIPKTLDMTTFRVIRRPIVDEVIKFNSRTPRVGLIMFSITRNIVNVRTEHHTRKDARSGYSVRRLVGDFFDNIFNYSSLPLRCASYLGFTTAVISFLLAIYYLIRYLAGATTVAGFATLVLLILFFSGLILMTLGVTGEYLIRIVHASDYNPQYVVREKINL